MGRVCKGRNTIHNTRAPKNRARVRKNGAIPAAGVRYVTREIAVRPGTLIVVHAQRTGGGAGTELTATARLFKLGR